MTKNMTIRKIETNMTKNLKRKKYDFYDTTKTTKISSEGLYKYYLLTQNSK